MSTVVKEPETIIPQRSMQPDQTPPPAVKVSFNVAPHQVDTLKQLAGKRQVSMTEVLRHAIALEALLDSELENDARLIIESKDGEARKEIVLFRT